MPARVLRAASVFGEEFPLEGVAYSPARPSTRLLEYWRCSGTRGISRGTGGFVFRHGLVRETCYAALTPEDRALGHRLAGEWLEQSTDTIRRCSPSTSIRRRARARRALVCTGRRPCRAGQRLRGRPHARRAWREPRAAGETLAELRLVELQVYGYRGEVQKAESFGWQAIEHAREGSPLWYSAVRELCAPLGELLKGEELATLADRAEAALADEAALSARTGCLSWMAGALIGSGNPEHARRLLGDCSWR